MGFSCTSPLSPRPSRWVFWLVRPHKVSNKVSKLIFCMQTFRESLGVWGRCEIIGRKSVTIELLAMCVCCRWEQHSCAITTRFSSTSHWLTPTLNAGTSWLTSASCSRWPAVSCSALLATAPSPEIRRVCATLQPEIYFGMGECFLPSFVPFLSLLFPLFFCCFPSCSLLESVAPRIQLYGITKNLTLNIIIMRACYGNWLSIFKMLHSLCVEWNCRYFFLFHLSYSCLFLFVCFWTRSECNITAEWCYNWI